MTVQGVDDHEARIVAMPRILRTRIAEPGDEERLFVHDETRGLVTLRGSLRSHLRVTDHQAATAAVSASGCFQAFSRG